MDAPQGTGSRTTVMLVEDEPPMRHLVAEVLRKNGFDVHAANLDRWVADVCEVSPDVLLLDLTLGPGVDAVEYIPEITASCPHTMIAALTAHEAEDLEASTLRAGAFVYYEKAMLDRLCAYLTEDLELFRLVLAGEQVVAPSALDRRLPRPGPSVNQAPRR